MERRETPPRSDAADRALVERLVQLCEQAAGRDRRFETTDSWMRHGGAPDVAEVIALLKQDSGVAQHAVTGVSVFVPGIAGWGYDLDAMLGEFLRRADGQSAELRRAEARLFLACAALRGDSMALDVRTTLAGVQLWNGLTVELPFGRLRPALPRDFAVQHLDELPPAAVFEYETVAPARIAPGSEYPFGGKSGEALAEQVRRDHDGRVDRMLLTFVVAGEGPVQEHHTVWSPRYSAGAVGINPIPLAPPVAPRPYFLASGADVDRLVGVAESLADLPLGRLGTVARWYLMATSERTRRTDQIIDFSIAVEALTGTSNGKAQAECLAALIGGHPAAGLDVKADHKLVKDARNLILHEGRTPPDAVQAASAGRRLVRLALEAAVRKALQERRAADQPDAVSSS